MPISGMTELLSMCRTISLMDLLSSPMFVYEKGILYILVGIMLPLLLVSIFYLHVSTIWLFFVFNFAIISNLML